MYSNNRFFVRKIKQTFYKHFSYVIKLILKYFYGLTLLLFLPSPRNAWRMTMKGLNGFSYWYQNQNSPSEWVVRFLDSHFICKMTIWARYCFYNITKIGVFCFICMLFKSPDMIIVRWESVKVKSFLNDPKVI